MRSRKALYNIITSLLLEIIQIISGLIIPRLIIGTYGSNVNGLVSSITQFLGYIILLEAGVGGVVRAALYRPLAKKNYEQISRIIKAAENFFKIIGLSFLGYLVLLVFLFPFIIDGFDRAFTSSLVLIIGISTFFQYYFSITYQILLQADQKQYVTTIIIIITTIINTFMVVILINLGFGIHIVKLGSTIIFIIRPILLNIYVKHKYKINSKVLPDKTAI
ncbi:MAG TPA: hypothetical protein PK887_11400, partial [Ignavibacteriales bacterium]|nr:hypothetical protein [Ignavibacteriales bacterium]